MSVAGRYVMGRVNFDRMDAVSYFSYDPNANLIEELELVIRIHPQRLVA